MSYLVRLQGTPVFSAWIVPPDRAYGIDVNGSIVNPVNLPIANVGTAGYKVALAKFPVDVVAAFFYKYVLGYNTASIYVGLGFPSHIVYLALIGVKP